MPRESDYRGDETMREIKFRIWDSANQEMTTALIGIYNGNVVGICVGTVLMQYTSLKDKNGKEIYEGDILQHPTKLFLTHPVKPVNGIVEYEAPSFIFSCPGHSLKECHEFEVIGNIYENPELLGEKE